MTVWMLSRHSVLASWADCGELYFPPSLENPPPLHCWEVFTHSALPCNYMPRLSTFKSTRSAVCARPSGALTQSRRLLSRIQHMPSARKSETDLPPQVRKWLGASCQRHSFAEETENVSQVGVRYIAVWAAHTWPWCRFEHLKCEHVGKKCLPTDPGPTEQLKRWRISWQKAPGHTHNYKLSSWKIVDGRL